MAGLPQSELVFLFTVGTTCVLLLTTFVVLFFLVYQKRILVLQQDQQRIEREFQQQMVQSQLESQEKERIRIASDLHDSVGSLLWSAKLNASFIERSVRFDGETKETHDELMTILDNTIQMVRRIAWELTPEAFHQTGLSQSLARLCQDLDGKGGLRVLLSQTGQRVWNNDAAMQAFRIVQELVSNVIKHAKASTLIINLTWRESELLIEVEDDGVGFSLDQTRSGVGWWNINQRITRLKGEITIGIPPSGKGAVVHLKLTLPYEK